jgi:hypothetical protein
VDVLVVVDVGEVDPQVEGDRHVLGLVDRSVETLGVDRGDLDLLRLRLVDEDEPAERVVVRDLAEGVLEEGREREEEVVRLGLVDGAVLLVREGAVREVPRVLGRCCP